MVILVVVVVIWVTILGEKSFIALKLSGLFEVSLRVDECSDSFLITSSKSPLSNL